MVQAELGLGEGYKLLIIRDRLMTEENLKHKTVTASKWSALTETASKIISPLVFIILARLLTPEDYGVVAVAAMVISLSQIFWDVGLSKALVQREDHLEETSNIVFWTNALLGILIYAVIFLFAGFISGCFQIPQAKAVIQVQGLQIIMTSLSSVQAARCQRELNFRKLFWIRLATAAVPGLASIPLAWLGYGYWALVGGALLGSTVQSAAFWLSSSWRPRLEYDLSIARQLLFFGAWVTAEGLLTWATGWIDAVILGAFWGPFNLGLFRTGNSFAILIFGLILSPILPVMFSSLSRMQQDRERIRSTLIKTTKFITLIALPVGAGLFAAAGPLSSIVFGYKWQGVSAVIGIMGLMHGISWIAGVNGEAYRAVGRPDLQVKIMAAGLSYYIPAFLLSAPYGLKVFLWVRLAVACVALPMHLYVVNKFLKINPASLAGNLKWILLASLVMGTAVSGLEKTVFASNEWIELLGLISIGALIYLVLLIPEMKFLKSLLTIIVRK